MGVYHSHSIQIARLIERAHSFARPPSATPLRLNVSQASSHLAGSRHLCFLNLPFDKRVSASNHRTRICLRKQIASHRGYNVHRLSRIERMIFYGYKHIFLNKILRDHHLFKFLYYKIEYLGGQH